MVAKLFGSASMHLPHQPRTMARNHVLLPWMPSAGASANEAVPVSRADQAPTLLARGLSPDRDAVAADVEVDALALTGEEDLVDEDVLPAVRFVAWVDRVAGPTQTLGARVWRRRRARALAVGDAVQHRSWRQAPRSSAASDLLTRYLLHACGLTRVEQATPPLAAAAVAPWALAPRDTDSGAVCQGKGLRGAAL